MEKFKVTFLEETLTLKSVIINADDPRVAAKIVKDGVRELTREELETMKSEHLVYVGRIIKSIEGE